MTTTITLELTDEQLDDLQQFIQDAQWTYDDNSGRSEGSVYCKCCGADFPSCRPWPYDGVADAGWCEHKPGCVVQIVKDRLDKLEEERKSMPKDSAGDTGAAEGNDAGSDGSTSASSPFRTSPSEFKHSAEPAESEGTHYLETLADELVQARKELIEILDCDEELSLVELVKRVGLDLNCEHERALEAEKELAEAKLSDELRRQELETKAKELIEALGDLGSLRHQMASTFQAMRAQFDNLEKM